MFIVDVVVSTKSTFEHRDRVRISLLWGKKMIAFRWVFFGHLGSTCLVFSGGVLLGVLSFELFVDISPSLSRRFEDNERFYHFLFFFGRGVYNFLSNLMSSRRLPIHIDVILLPVLSGFRFQGLLLESSSTVIESIRLCGRSASSFIGYLGILGRAFLFGERLCIDRCRCTWSWKGHVYTHTAHR